jgi:2-keto-4-pentenoate hydratase/2-oxohepta-3-ene-1,7-dioic acid hydratase in catechol pathway
MKLVTFTADGSAGHVGAFVDDGRHVIDVTAARPDRPELRSMQSLIEAGEAGLGAVREIVDGAGPVIPRADVRLLPPVPVPAQLRDCLCFEEHLKGAFRAARKLVIAAAQDPAAKQKEADGGGLYPVPDVWYQQPIYYKGNRFACAATEEEVPWPRYSELLDYELEIGCWISRTGKDISREQAAGHIFGYSIFNDITARDAQRVEMEGGLGPAKGKDFDKSNVIGPCIVTADELDPYNLTMIARVNGEEWSVGHSSTMHWRFEDVIAHVSASETLYPGEFLGSGTVGGGCGLELERFLKPGDVVELEVEDIGTLSNRIVRDVPALTR